MSDLEERLREAISASVAGAEPTFDVMSAVRRRHRRWLFRVTAAMAAAVTAATAAAVLLGAPHGKLGHAAPAASATKPNAANHASPLFPGGGRLLLSGGDVGGLTWLYPDGKTVRFAPGFAGAAVSAGGLLAWKQAAGGFDYYTMKLDGSGQRLVLGATSGAIQVRLSPDGSRLAYLRQQYRHGDTLWVADLATGQRADLGPASDLVAWRDSTTILADAAGARALLLINVNTQTRSTYLTVSDPLLVSAYQRARPGAGRPAYIDSSGWSASGTPAPLAVWLAAANPAGQGVFPGERTFTKPAELLLARRTVLGSYAPATPQQLDFTWGPNGLFLIQTGAGNDPGSWRTYAGTLHSDRLSRPTPFGTNGITFNPAGNVIALQNDSAEIVFFPTPQPACERAAKCLNFQAQFLTGQGDLQAWAR